MSRTSTVDVSYAVCRGVSRQSRSNFRLSFLLLPSAKRRAMEALYAFMRHTDDLADCRQPVEQRRRALVEWRALLASRLADGPPSGGRTLGGDSPLVSGEILLPALADTVSRFGIPRERLEAVLDGVEMDLEHRRYKTFDELAVYCHRVASAVGLACLHVWGFPGGNGEVLAERCGLAFQLTNILRDLGQDVREGRVYLPQEDLARFGYTEEDLREGVTDQRFDRLMAFEIDRARDLYRQGAGLFDLLGPEGRPIFGAMFNVYRGLLAEIERRPADVFTRRIRLGRCRKLAIVAGWGLFPRRKLALR